MAQIKQPLTPTEARQASPRRMNLRVLVGSLFLALAAGFLFYASYTRIPQTASTVPQQGQPQ